MERLTDEYISLNVPHWVPSEPIVGIRLVTSVDFKKAPSSSTLTCLRGYFSFFNFVRMNKIIQIGDLLGTVGNVHIIIIFAHTKMIIDIKPWIEVTLKKAKTMWRSSPDQRLVVSTVAPLGKVVIFVVKILCTGLN